MTADLRRSLAQAYLRSSWSVQQVSASGRLQELVTGFANSGANLVWAFANGIISGCSVGAMLLLAVGVDPLGSLIAVAAVAVLGSVLRPLRRKVQAHAGRAAANSMSLATTTNEVAELGMAMHVFDVRSPVIERVVGVLEQGRRSSRRLMLVRGLVPAIYSGLAYLVLVGAVGVANLSDTTKLTSLGAVMLVMLRSLSYGQQLQVSYSNVNASLPQVREVFAEIDHYEQQAISEDGSRLQAVCPLVLDDVGFAYVEGNDVLSGVSATIGPAK